MTIVGAGFLYPFIGGVEDGQTIYRIDLVPAAPALADLGGAVEALSRGIYFSAITFTTIGYANVAPHGPWSRVLVGIESLVGAILIALFVYVLGRRTAR
ncbi:potassium channel family protein [Halosimplex aquaticum]